MQSAVLCVRVSPRPAENVRYSPDIQEQKCRDWCAKHGIPVVDVVRDILVSGGATNRFESIFRAIDTHRPTHFVVSDLSRWTRDRPSRFWAMKAVLEDNGIQLVSVDEEYLSTGDMPFSDSITTIRVEANYQQRIESNRKTAAGVRRAWASGKRFGAIWGWTFDPLTRQYTQDIPRIKSFFEDYANGMSTHALARTYGVRPSHVSSHLRAASQRDVVGDELWGRVQSRLARRSRVQRWDAAQSSLYRGLLFCPFCAARMTHHSPAWNNYRCVPPRQGEHPWTMMSATEYVEPQVREVLDSLYLPDDQAEALRMALAAPQGIVAADPEAIRREIERHAVSWAKGRLSDERYEALIAELEEELAHVPAIPPTPSEQIMVVRNGRMIDLQERHPVLGRLTNALLRELFMPFTIHEDRTVDVSLKPEFAHWRKQKDRPPETVLFALPSPPALTGSG